MTEWGIDTLFNPGKRHMDEEKRRLQSTREEIGDSSGGRRIDLESGTVTISRRSKDAPVDSEDAADAAHAVDSGDSGDSEDGTAEAAEDETADAAKDESAEDETADAEAEAAAEADRSASRE